MMKNIYKNISLIAKSHGSTNIATSLRALAAIGVLSVHFEWFGLYQHLRGEDILQRLLKGVLDLAAQGPTTFYLASGYVLQLTYKKYKNLGAFMLQRYFRLMPLYLAVNSYCYLASERDLSLLSVELILKKLFFLDLFFTDASIFSPLNISHFVVIEFWLSILIFFTHKLQYRSNLVSVYVIIISFTISYLAQKVSRVIESEIDLSFFYFQFFFVFGAAMAAKRHIFSLNKLISLNLFILCFLFAILVQNYVGYMSFVMSAVVLANSKPLNNTILTNIFMRVTGNICYSIFLLHIPVKNFTEYLEFQETILTVPFIFFLSTISFFLIEVPFTKIGKKVTKSL